jgi:hypothetical protein
MRPGEAHDALAMVIYEGKPAALLIADGAAAAERAASAAELAGCRVLTSAGLDEAVEVLADPPSHQLVIAELEQDRPELDGVLKALARSARAGKGVVVSAPFELTDAVTALAWDACLLSRPTEEQMVEAIAEAAKGSSAQLHDNSREQLHQLSQEAARIASALASLSASAETSEAGEPARQAMGEIDAAKIRAIIRARRLREHYFPPDLFADPAWDMLLDLMAARLEDQHVAVSSLCIAAAVPATTALRWIKALTDQGLFVRVADPSDGRRVHIELSDGAATALLGYLKAAQRLAPIVI